MRTTFTAWRRATPRLIRRPRFLSVPWRLHRTMLKGGLRLAPDPGLRLVRRRCAKVPDQNPRGFGARVYGWLKVRGGQWVLTLSRLDRGLTIERTYAEWTPEQVRAAVIAVIRLCALADLADTGDDSACAAYWKAFDAEFPQHNPKET